MGVATWLWVKIGAHNRNGGLFCSLADNPVSGKVASTTHRSMNAQKSNWRWQRKGQQQIKSYRRRSKGKDQDSAERPAPEARTLCSCSLVNWGVLTHSYMVTVELDDFALQKTCVFFPAGLSVGHCSISAGPMRSFSKKIAQISSRVNGLLSFFVAPNWPE